MEKIINKVGNEIKIYADTIEEEAYNQIESLANSEPYLNEKIRIMPDAHAGKGCTIGTTMTITDKVTPNLVGVDVNCGIRVMKLKEKELNLQKLDETIRKFVPSGFNVNEFKTDFDFSLLRCAKEIDLERPYKSIGTLGGGNHFIEIDMDDEGSLYLLVHSGSRSLGVNMCKHYQDIALKKVGDMSIIKNNLIDRLKKEGRENEIEQKLKEINRPFINKDFAYIDGQDFDDYMNDMILTGVYARENRLSICMKILENMGLHLESTFETVHNYVDGAILRKGAVSARLGERFVCPMNMRDGSLICVGKGNEDWNFSAPHGAGRLMSRSKAKGNISIEEYRQTMDGIYSTSVTESTIDEAPQAYKPMDEIIRAIEPTASIEKIIKPIYNFKASE